MTIMAYRISVSLHLLLFNLILAAKICLECHIDGLKHGGNTFEKGLILN